MIERIVFWFITPPNNMKSIIEYFCQNWTGSVRLVSLHHVTEERRKVGWNSQLDVDVALEILDDHNDPEAYGEHVLKTEINSIHIFCGLTKGPGKYLHMYKRIKRNNGCAFVISEPKSLVGSKSKIILKRVFGKIYYIMERISVQKCVKGVFVTGSSGVRQFEKYGWDSNYIFNFMYTPYYRRNDKATDVIKKKTNEELRFLYIGRFNFYTRGLDTLMKAIEGLPNEAKWKLTLVGGYGENSKQVIDWSKRNNNVEYLGSWNPDTVSQRMADYDVYICPTNIDGWNTQINEALLANTGVITTDAAGSDELINASKAGIVFDKGDSKALKEAMIYCLDNPSIIIQWSERANQYKNCIHPNTVSMYMIECIKYALGEKEKKPNCPWVKSS